VIRRLLPPLLLVLLVLAPGAEAATSVDVLAKLGTRVDKAREASGVRVLLPAKVASIAPGRKVHGGGSWDEGEYELHLGYAKRCNGAQVCTLGSFLASRGAVAFDGDPVGLARGRLGYVSQPKCGAYCPPPQIQWKERRVLYTISIKLKRRSRARPSSGSPTPRSAAGRGRPGPQDSTRSIFAPSPRRRSSMRS